MRPKELAAELDVSPKSLRAWLRREFPRDPLEYRTEWHLTGEQVETARSYWKPKDRTKSAALRSRKHGWVEDEVLLALYLYRREGVSASVGSIAQLSETLRALPIERELAADEAFRSTSSVKFKLGNFESIASGGALGFANASMLDKEIWFAYLDDYEGLERDALTILNNLEGSGPIGPIEADEEPPLEGRVVAEIHKRRERDAALRKRKVASAKSLACEACGFDFGAAYGSRGEGFVECHHLVPLADLGASGRHTTVDDLALLCANCHRMIHRSRPWLTLSELKLLVDMNGAGRA